MKWNITTFEKPSPASDILRDQSLPKLLWHFCIYYPLCTLYLLLHFTQFCPWTSIHSHLIETFQWIFQVLNMFLGLPQGLSSKESTCKARDIGDMRLIPGLGRSPGGGHGHSLQYSFLESPWTEEPEGLQAIRSQSRTRLKWLSTHACTGMFLYPMSTSVLSNFFKFHKT